MEILRPDLDWAATEGLITAKQADDLWAALERRLLAAPRAAAAPPPATKARFDAVHVAYYFGALIVIAAMGWFMDVGWKRFGGAGMFAISCAYAFGFVLAGRSLWHKQKLVVPGGLLITLAVGMTPLGVYGLERWLELAPQNDYRTYSAFHELTKSGWFAAEVATIVAALVALRFYRFPFLTTIIAFTLWYMTMDIAPLVFDGSSTWNQRAWTSAGVGFSMLIAGYLIDRRTDQDFAFWLYLFGLGAFWGGLTALQGTSELHKVGYLAINLALMLIAVLIARRTFIVFGALGVAAYVGHLAYEVFRDSLLFPFALSVIGIAIIAGGVRYHRRREAYEKVLLDLVPASLRGLLPPQRAAR